MDRLISKATPEGTLNYTYDAAGHVAGLVSSNANGANVSYTYDNLNRLSTVTDNRLGGATTTYTYDNASNVQSITYPNGVQTIFHYDQSNRVSGVATQASGYLYQRDPMGNLTGATELSGRTVNWTYDGIHRLTNETITADPASKDGSVSYGLDPVGNRNSVVSSLGGVSSGTWSYNADDQRSSESYDANGNAQSVSGKLFGFNTQNELIEANSGAVRMVYDALGNRVSKTANGVTTQYLVDDLSPTGVPQVIDELTNGVVTRTYTYGLRRISEDQIVNKAWAASYFGYDGGGSVRQLTNSAGAITDTYNYDAFGNLITSTGSTPNNYLYRGEQWDSDLSLYYLRARYYNPMTGRFLSRDPVPGNLGEPATLHRYLYARDNPANRVDPSGRDDEADVTVLDAEVSVAETAAVREYERTLGCIYLTAASTLAASVSYNPYVQTLVSLTPVFAGCGAESEEESESVVPGTCPMCFAAGTPVHTNQGDVPIEKIRVGEEVEARDSATGREEYKPVTALVPGHPGRLVEIRVAGERQPLRASVGHPFWVERDDATAGTWIAAGQLRLGDRLLTMKGEWRAITAITPVTGEVTVYNFTVAKDHDYFVGETGFLVHNANCEPCEGHHIIPKFLGGNPNGKLAFIPQSYHRLITNAFRTIAAGTGPGYGYDFSGNGFPTAPERLDILRKVYKQYPLDQAIEACSDVEFW